MSKKNRVFSIKVWGDSMYPLLQDGDIIEYIRTPSSYTIKLDDIVLVYINDILFTHRVIYKTKSTYITRGDNNSIADPAIRKERIFAKVVRYKRNGVWRDIQDVYFSQSSLYLNEIQKLENIFQSKKIPHVFFKGVLISIRYERAIPKHIYADCDILVERTNIIAIKKIFSQLGYKLIKQWNVSDMVIPEINFQKIINNIPITFDLHFEPHFLSGKLGTAVNYLYPFSQRRQLTRQTMTTIQHKKINSNIYPILSPSMQILYLALHIFHHNYTDCVRYQLLDYVIRKSVTKKTWNDIHSIVREYHLEGYLYLVFIFLKKYFKTSIPSSFFVGIHPSKYKLLIVNFMIRHTNIFNQDNHTKAGIKRFFLIFFLSPELLCQKLLFIVHPQTLYMGLKFAISFLFSKRHSRLA